MRRLLQGLTGAGLACLVSALVGCHHMVGVCDCEGSPCPDVRNCPNCAASATPTGVPLAPVGVPGPTTLPAVRSDGLREMPRAQ